MCVFRVAERRVAVDIRRGGRSKGEETVTGELWEYLSSSVSTCVSTSMEIRTGILCDKMGCLSLKNAENIAGVLNRGCGPKKSERA